MIAETTDLPTRFARMVVTDDQGRYVLPDLPRANYQVWVRGYGLVDSPKLHGVPGKHLDHMAVAAPNEKAAAHYYPAIYWYAMMTVPDASASLDLNLSSGTFQCWMTREPPMGEMPASLWSVMPAFVARSFRMPGTNT